MWPQRDGRRLRPAPQCHPSSHPGPIASLAGAARAFGSPSQPGIQRLCLHRGERHVWAGVSQLGVNPAWGQSAGGVGLAELTPTGSREGTATWALSPGRYTQSWLQRRTEPSPAADHTSRLSQETSLDGFSLAPATALPPGENNPPQTGLTTSQLLGCHLAARARASPGWGAPGLPAWGPGQRKELVIHQEGESAPPPALFCLIGPGGEGAETISSIQTCPINQESQNSVPTTGGP